MILKYGSDKNYIDLTVEYGCLPLFKDDTNEIKKAKILTSDDLSKCIKRKYLPWSTNKDYHRIKFVTHIFIYKDDDRIKIRFYQPTEHQISEDNTIFAFKGAYSLDEIYFDDLSEKEQRIVLSNLIKRTKGKRPTRRKISESFTKKTSGVTSQDIQKRVKVIDDIDKLKNFIVENGYKDYEDEGIVYNFDIKDWDVIGVDFDLLDNLG